MGKPSKWYVVNSSGELVEEFPTKREAESYASQRANYYVTMRKPVSSVLRKVW